MNIKSMLVKLAEEQADKVELEIMNKIKSESFAEKTCSKIQ